MPITLGIEARDRVTGFKGRVTGICRYLSGCHQALLVPKTGSDGAYRDGQWFDLQRLEVTNNKAIALDNVQSPGFDKAAPKR